MTRRERQLERAAASHAEARRTADEALARETWKARSELPTTRIAERIGRSRRGLYDLWQRVGLMALVVLITFVSVPASADAHKTHGMAEWQRLGQAYFPNACGPVELDTSHQEPAPSAGAVAWTYSPPTCRLVIGEIFHAYPPRMQCAMIIHEYGHLAGLGHSDDPTSIMHPSGSAIPAKCPSDRVRKSVRVHAGSRR